MIKEHMQQMKIIVSPIIVFTILNACISNTFTVLLLIYVYVLFIKKASPKSRNNDFFSSIKLLSFNISVIILKAINKIE